MVTIHPKTDAANWIPLYNEVGARLHPELMEELEEIKPSRIGGPMLCRDWGDRGPWPTYPI
jgi:hypothetical protein